MNDLLNKFGTMPKPVQAGVMLASGGGVVAAGNLLFGANALAVFVAGVALVGLLLLGYKHLLKVLAARRANPMEQAIKGNAGAAPLGVAAPAQRARLDDMRKQFETGMDKFKAAGKNVYALPWYLLVGEPGSGKTEAIRHCNVGFPPGLQDQLQGAGGTLNMNWWFTNYAVILDTAGRLMFEEVVPGSTNEWQEFLKLLRRSRPNCPVNGMLLVIPSESLIKDSAEVLEKKGGKIAQQLDAIQRALGVRFPVYVVVTKCDLINGFREFFDGIADPGLQHQMMGWSNPSSLDTPFNPELVDQHLDTVKQRLLRRRLALLQDPVNTDDPRARRTDQVDALYEFPDAFMDIAPRLKRYLQMVFVAGEWSAKPLFLRGIYFTSSMREGEALDAKLAAALGMAVESLPEGKVWDRERAYFLRDLFMSKVFKEKGLVTRASNTSSQQRGRRNILFSVSAGGLALLGALMWFGYGNLRERIVTPSKFWGSLPEAMRRDRVMKPQSAPGTETKPGEFSTGWAFPIVDFVQGRQSAYSYLGTDSGREIEEFDGLPIFPGENKRRAGLPMALRDAVKYEITIPWVYRPVAWFSKDSEGNLASAKRADAARALYLSGVMRPVIDAARAKLNETLVRSDSSDPPGPIWTPETAGAITQLLRLEVGYAMTGQRPSGAPPEPARPLDLAPLLHFILNSWDDEKSPTGPLRTKAAADVNGLEQARADLFSAGSTWLPPEPAMVPPTGAEFTSWIGAMEKRLDSGSEGSDLSRIQALIDALTKFRSAEQELHKLVNTPDLSGKPWSEWVVEWERRFRNVTAARDLVQKHVGVIEKSSLTKAFDDAWTRQVEDQRRVLTSLTDELAPVAKLTAADAAKTPSSPANLPARLSQLKTLNDRLGELTKRLASVDPKGPMGEQAKKERASLEAAMTTADGWKVRYGLYEAADRDKNERERPPKLNPGEIAERLKALVPALQVHRDRIRQLPYSPSDDLGKKLLEDGRAVALRAHEIGATREVSNLVDKGMVKGIGYPDTAEAIGDLVATIAKSEKELAPPVRPKLPLTRDADGFDARYSPKAAAKVLSDYLVAASVLNPAPTTAASGAPAGDSLVAPMDRDPLRSGFEKRRLAAIEYARDFGDYWSRDLFTDRGAFPVSARDWASFQAGLRGSAQFRELLEPVGAALVEAADAASQFVSTPACATDKDAKAALDRVVSWRDATRKGLDTRDTDSVQRGVDRVTRWRGLGDQVWNARKKLAEELRASKCKEFCMPASVAGADDFVREYFHRLTVAGFTALANDPDANTADIAARLLRLHKFPLAEWSGPDELEPQEVEAALKDLDLPIGSVGGNAINLNSECEWPAPIKEAIDSMFGRSSVPPDAANAIADMQARRRYLPAAGKPGLVIITYLSDPARAGEKGVRTHFQYMKLAGETLIGGACVQTRTDSRLGEIPFYSGRLAFRLFVDNANCEGDGPTAEFPSKWVPLYIRDRFKSDAAGMSFEAVVRVKTADGREYDIPVQIKQSEPGGVPK